MADTETDTDTDTDTDSDTKKPRPARTPEQVSADLEAARQSLVAHVDAIQEHIKPANVVGRGLDRIQRVYVSAEGKPNVRNIAFTVGVLTVFVLYRVRR